MKQSKRQTVVKTYARWIMGSVLLLCVGCVFLIEASARLDINMFERFNIHNLFLTTPIVCSLACLCGYMAQGREYTKGGLRWLIASIVLLSLGLMFLFETMANVGSDIFGPFNFVALALISSLLCSMAVICSSYADKFKEA